MKKNLWKLWYMYLNVISHISLTVLIILLLVDCSIYKVIELSTTGQVITLFLGLVIGITALYKAIERYHHLY